jgi:GH25 family lysozyme M1 (1,4-beta-N-acetylmuramidase)
MFRFIIALVAVIAVANASNCDSITSKSDCSLKNCSWCSSGAVGDSCVSNEDAAALPSSVFTCTKNVDAYYFMSSNDCESFSDESKCMNSHECSWCDSAAVGSSCMSSSDAAGLPAAVFTCKDASSSSMLGASDKPGTTWQWSVSLDMFEGVIGGFFNEDAPDLKGCANNAVNVYNAFDAAIKELHSDDSTITKVENGMEDMGNALLGIESLLKDCQSTAPEMKSLLDTITTGFKSPKTFAYHVGKDLIVNGVDIYHEITAAVSAWESQSYKECGNQIGLALHALLIGEPDATPATVGSYYFMSTSDCESVSDQKTCTSSSGCSWCDSAAVGSSCMSSGDAAGLPAAVFTCTDASLSKKLGVTAKPSADNYYFMSTGDCESISDESKCTSTSGCSFCSSAAVGDSCMSSDDAAGLPAAVFTCKDAKVSSKKKLFAGVGSWFDKPVLKATAPVTATTCESITDSKTCLSTQQGSEHCAWCESSAVKSSCYAQHDAQELPKAVFDCSYGFQYFPEEEVSSALFNSDSLGLSGGSMGVDISQPLSSSTASCFASNGVSYVVPRAYKSSGSVDTNSCGSLTQAKNAGINNRGVYMFPSPQSSKSAATQINELTNYLNSCSAFTGMIWLDIEGSQYWLGSSSANQAWYQSLASACQSSGYSCGVYTSASQWSAIFGSSSFSHGGSMPLWYAHYDNNPSFSDFSSFGGWSSPSVKQYQGDTTLCGFGVDMDYGNP